MEKKDIPAAALLWAKSQPHPLPLWTEAWKAGFEAGKMEAAKEWLSTEDEIATKVWHSGYDDGFDSGYDRGYTDGYNDERVSDDNG